MLYSKKKKFVLAEKSAKNLGSANRKSTNYKYANHTKIASAYPQSATFAEVLQI
jgi:hypothetical protein